MFGILKNNYKIQKAFQIARNELGIDPERQFGGITSSIATAWREQAREMIKAMDLNDKELAVVISAPYAPLVKDPYQAEQIEERIKFWSNLGVVRKDIAEHFLNELHHGTFNIGDI